MHSRYRKSKKLVRAVVQTQSDTKEDPKVDMGMVVTSDKIEEEVDPQHVLITVILVMSRNFSPNHTFYVLIFIVLNM
jgi:hypothetical protein